MGEEKTWGSSDGRTWKGWRGCIWTTEKLSWCERKTIMGFERFKIIYERNGLNYKTFQYGNLHKGYGRPKNIHQHLSNHSSSNIFSHSPDSPTAAKFRPVYSSFPPLSSRWCTRLSLPPGEKLEGRCDTTGGTLLGWCEGCAIPEDTPEHQGFNQSMKQREGIVSCSTKKGGIQLSISCLCIMGEEHEVKDAEKTHAKPPGQTKLVG